MGSAGEPGYQRSYSHEDCCCHCPALAIFLPKQGKMHGGSPYPSPLEAAQQVSPTGFNTSLNDRFLLLYYFV